MRRAAAVAVGLAAAACGRAPGVVTGEVFVVIETGAQLEAIGAPVRLVRDEPRADTALALLCARRRDALAAVDPGAGEARDRVLARAWAARAGLLGGAEVASTSTGPRGAFRLDGLPRGRYRLGVDALVQGERWSWMVPLRLGRGDSVHLSLGNHNADGDPFRCQIMRALEDDAPTR
jgi:hypothetical protein